MRAKTYKLQCIGIRFAVDRDQVRPDMTIAKTLPITAQGVIPVPFGQGAIMTKGFDDAGQIVVQHLAITPPSFHA